MIKFARRGLLIGAVVLGVLAVAQAPATAQSHNPDRIRVALLPDQDPLTVIWANKPLAAYLEERLGRPVDLVVPDDYAAIIDAMATGEVELAYFGPASYTIAHERVKEGPFQIEPFAARMRDGGTTYQSVVVANAESGFSEIEALEGSGVEVAYGDPASTSSHLAPRFMLLQAGIAADEDYDPVHLGSHDAVAEAVQIGDPSVGALSKVIFERLVRERKIDPAKVVVIGATGPLPQYPWTMRSDLAEDLKTAIRDAFFELRPGSPWADAVLRPFGAEGFAPMRDGDYDIIRSIRAQLG
ncbi:MAG: phosphate/phosphite/phosphonate ABC transporter substrate-binding protein [Pikeienuella sp.]